MFITFPATHSRTGCTECSKCPLGKEPATRNPGAYACVDCIPGMHRNSTMGSFCDKCESGYFQLNQGKENCKLCPEGYYCPYPSSEPMPCSEGAHCPNGSVMPIFCDNTLMEYDSTIKVSKNPFLLDDNEDTCTVSYVSRILKCIKA